MIEHFTWKDYGQELGGRFAIRAEQDRFSLKVLSGNDPLAAIVPMVLGAIGIKDQCDKLHSYRVNQYAVEKKVGQYGSLTLLLRINQDPEWFDYPIIERLHISMYGKIRGIKDVWFGDLPPLFRAAGLWSSDPNSSIDLIKAEIPKLRWMNANESGGTEHFQIGCQDFELNREESFILDSYGNRFKIMSSSTSWKSSRPGAAARECPYGCLRWPVTELDHYFEEIEGTLQSLGIDWIPDCERELEPDEDPERWKSTGHFVLKWLEGGR